jgi:hypothetical protein
VQQKPHHAALIHAKHAPSINRLVARCRIAAEAAMMIWVGVTSYCFVVGSIRRGLAASLCYVSGIAIEISKSRSGRLQPVTDMTKLN